MPLASGMQLGSYQITALIGVGGMGEVYRATDANLGRQVAIKVLSEAFAQDAERLARFEREARTLASLNHPNIAIIHGLEQSDGVRALVMELVEGPTLADRLAHGAIPVDETLAIGKQIAEALEAAHEQGIVHRDLKPANVKVRDDGTVKVLDFGLAKVVDGGASSAPASVGHSYSPTITTPAMTQLGMILGTAAYMAPEQARGKPVDKRSDIWAFGCVLFEMLTGKKAFDGEDVTDTIAAVVRAEPKWEALPAQVPTSIRLLLRRCLEKDRKKRIGDIAAVLFVMREAEFSPASSGSDVLVPGRPHVGRRVAAYALTAVAAGLAGAVGVWMVMRADAPRVTRLELTTSGDSVLSAASSHRITITPDGSQVIYAVGTPGSRSLFVRRLDALESTRLADDADRPFVSPDGRWVGFFSMATLKKVAITGGPSIEIAKFNGGPRGATWGADGTIVFATNDPATGLLRVSSEGGESAVLTRPNTAKAGDDHLWPRFLPGGRGVLFTISRSTGAADENSQVAVLDLQSPSPAPRVLVRGGSDARYVSTGHLVYMAGGSLRAVRFDIGRLEVLDGAPMPVVPGVATVQENGGDFEIAGDGTLVYVPQGQSVVPSRTLAWVDRSGKEEAIPVEPKAYLYPRISPQGDRIALDVREGDDDIWVWDLSRRTSTRVTKDPTQDRLPIWTADGQHIIYTGAPDGLPNLYRQRANGDGTPERLTNVPAPQFPVSLSPTGTHVIVAQGSGGPERNDLMILPLDTGGPSGSSSVREAQPLVRTPNGEINGTISPDGEWLAYQSNESGSWDVYLRPFADPSGTRSILSTGGGTSPRWSNDGRELYYVSPRREMMRVDVRTGARSSPGRPEVLFDVSRYLLDDQQRPYFMYDVAKDGRFLLVKPVAGQQVPDTQTNLVVILNWFTELKRLVPQ